MAKLNDCQLTDDSERIRRLRSFLKKRLPALNAELKKGPAADPAGYNYLKGLHDAYDLALSHAEYKMTKEQRNA